jgi:hypothetical protein
MNIRSYPLRVVIDESLGALLAGAGVTVIGDSSCRLEDVHFDAIEAIKARESRPGHPIRRQNAIYLALYAYCQDLTEGKRYASFTDLVRDALLWYSAVADQGGVADGK